LPKSARGDIRALMSIEERWFRRVTGDFLVLRRMILAYRSLLKTHKQLLNKYRALSEAEREVLKPAISSIEKQLEEMAKKIDEEAGKRYPAYNVLLEGLGIDDGLAGREALAELLTNSSQNYLGLSFNAICIELKGFNAGKWGWLRHYFIICPGLNTKRKT